tara:strand:+ start:48 stop:629 length:582 start_codon:yes stop_codon:yes gene_type:complete
MKLIIMVFIFSFFSTFVYSSENKIYLAGGCFWCLEQAFQEELGVISAVSGYSGGKSINPSYKDVSKGDTGHIEALEILYDDNLVSINELLEIFFKNIDPFDEKGQFCDRGYQYQSAIFINNKSIETIANKYISKIEKKFVKKVKTMLLKFDKFYKAEDYHQDYYLKNPIRYNLYKKGCGRENRLKKISIKFND